MIPMTRHVILSGLLLLVCTTGSRAQRVLWEQRFDSPSVMNSWQANADVDEVRIESGALLCRGAGGDPVPVYRPEFEINASPFQAVEVRVKADRDGLAEIFWSGTTEGKYGGFSGDKRSEFGVRGDGALHTYRVFPFWQKERKIVRFRFDPYQGARFAIKSIRIVEWQPGTSGPDVDFRRGVPWSMLRAVSGRNSASGVALTLEGPDGLAVGRMPNLDAAGNPIVSLRLSTRTAHRAALLFATDDGYGLQQSSFALEADGKTHVYNLDMLNAPGWHGKIVALGIRPGEAAGDGLTLERVTVANSPRGPADVRLLRFGAAEALPRAGLPMTVVATVSNSGGAAARGLAASLVLPHNVRRVKTEAGTSAPLRFGDEREWRWLIVPAKTGRLRLRLQARSQSGPLTAETTVNVAPHPAFVANDYVPVPHPVKPKVEVGAYYFPGWKSAGQWAPITRFPERRPVLGWYREGDPEVADWQIKWAVEHGITFFAYDWYWQQGVQQLDHALKDGLFKARYRDMLKFCLLWANHNATGSSSLPDCVAVAKFWSHEYFGRSEYLRIDGKPVVIIFSPYRLREDMGSANVRAAFDAMRAKCSAARTASGESLHGLYLIACVGSIADAKLAEQEGYDAITAYNWPGLGVTGSERWSPYSSLIDGYRRQWESLASAVKLPLMTPVSGGWDNRPWAGDGALVRSERTPLLFHKHLQDANAFIESHPKSTLPFVLAEAWNEWGEGSYIEPHQEFGFGYLDAIRDVFAPNARGHVDLTPLDVGRAAAQVTFGSLERARWEFARDLQGWDSGMQVTAPKVDDRALSITTIGIDPALFGPPIQVSAQTHPILHLRARARGSSDGAKPPDGDTAQMFWSTRTTPESEANSVRFPLKADGLWHDYRIRLADNPRWRGQITRLRLDPCERSGVTVEVGAIELLPDTRK